MQTCDGNLGRPFAGAVQDALFDRLHVAGVVLVLHAEHRPARASNTGCMDVRGCVVVVVVVVCMFGMSQMEERTDRMAVGDADS